MAAYLDWLAAHDADWRSPGRATLRAYLAELSVGHARTSVAQRLAALRAFHRYCARSGLAPGDPWGAVATPRLPRRLPKVLEVEQVEALLAVIDDDLAAAAAGTSRTARHDPELARAIALRDRALVETAYAAGLRISELAAADLASLDLRRGELRVMGKGRKERIGLLGRPAREALTAYLDEARPVLDARRDPLAGDPAEVFLNHRGGPLGVRGLRMRLDRLRRLAGLPGGRQPAHPAPLVRHAPPRGRRGPARGPGAAGPREPRHDAGLHARLAGAPAGRVPAGASAGAGHLMDDPDVLTGVVADEEPALHPVAAASGLSRGRVVGAGPGPRRPHRHRDVPRGAGPRLRPDHRLRRRVPGHRRAGAVLCRLPDPGPPVPARRGGSPLVGTDPGDRRAVRDGRGRPRLAGGLDGRDPHALGPARAGGTRHVVRARVRGRHHARVQRGPAAPRRRT